MKTKLAYVVVGNDKNVFIEQAFVSMWSAKYHNPDILIAVVMDSDTENTLKKRPFYEKFIGLSDEIIVRDFEPSVSGMIRSRWLKTKLRELVTGDFLYLDVDTVIAGKLDDLDSLPFSIGFVLDFNTSFEKNRSAAFYKKSLKEMFGISTLSDNRYFNGGVFFSRDDEMSREFFKQWFDNWIFCRNKGYYRDQLALFKTTQENYAKVKELDGSFNCQLSENLQYFYEGKILHFYMSDKNMTPFSPFFKNGFYEKIRTLPDLADDLIEKIKTCKSSFEGPTKVLSGSDERIYQSAGFWMLKTIYNRNYFLFRAISFFSKVILKLVKK